jgi:hypothetical protein
MVVVRGTNAALNASAFLFRVAAATTRQNTTSQGDDDGPNFMIDAHDLQRQMAILVRRVVSLTSPLND